MTKQLVQGGIKPGKFARHLEGYRASSWLLAPLTVAPRVLGREKSVCSLISLGMTYGRFDQRSRKRVKCICLATNRRKALHSHRRVGKPASDNSRMVPETETRRRIAREKPGSGITQIARENFGLYFIPVISTTGHHHPRY